MAAKLPGVSFIIPVYNKAAYLPKVLAAIAAQTGDFPSEFIFVDDGSIDDSLNLVRELTQGWENLTIIQQANHGSAHATNRAIERASQPYLKFVDADDLLAARAAGGFLSGLGPRDPRPGATPGAAEGTEEGGRSCPLCGLPATRERQ